MPKILSLKDWINSFWNFQEEDLKYFQDLIEKKIPFEPREILDNIREKVKRRKIFYQIYKYLPKEELSLIESRWIEQKLTEIIYREELITQLITKILELLSYYMDIDEISIPEISSIPFILH